MEAENQSMPTVRVPSGFLNSLTPLLDEGSHDPASTARSPAIGTVLAELPQATKPQPRLLDHDGEQCHSQPNGDERGAPRKTHIELGQLGE